ncbi:ABC transporter ATP-binding protein [Actinopolymorpha singaporensis]|uniref:ABC-type quaternary amine transporter n=1 Tax=Actinopolymorpha singaporensis TaxID=117157 RepID=A0A1H1TQ59_9ACTN|nr:ABC transporter ATP-binding protein [Actinopolymorpha singaporensis]SDS62274.1 iron(III) transport system ATP-binding protein [Actinopolymorpha singaporensis]
MRSLQLSGITASHSGTPVLHGIDLAVRAGSTTAVLGPSGCGKTTLLRVVAGFMRPDTGEVRVGDEVVAGPGVWVAPEKRGLGYVAQEGNLFPHLDVAANISYGLPRRERRARAGVGDLLELVGLTGDLAHRRPDQLSGGQQQRVALARALARRPRIVLLDEPFSALDPELRVATREAVAAALAHEQATVVLVTHDRAEALSFADQVAIMHEGRLTQVGAPAYVYRAPTDRRSAVSLGEACFLPGWLDNGVVTCALGELPVPDVSGSGPCEVLIRPEQLRLGEPTASPYVAEVTRTVFYGHDALVELRLDDPRGDSVDVSARVLGDEAPAVGSRVSVRVVGTPHVVTLDGAHPG